MEAGLFELLDQSCMWDLMKGAAEIYIDRVHCLSSLKGVDDSLVMLQEFASSGLASSESMLFLGEES